MKCEASKSVPMLKAGQTAKYPKYAKNPDLWRISGISRFEKNP
jgi:hypothetical protein